MTATTSAPGSPAGGDAAPPEVRSWAWHAMQVTAWLLLIALPIHLYSIWLAHDASHFGVATFVDRWHSAGWRVFDWAFLVLALAHGGIGLCSVVSSRTTSPSVRTAVATVTAVVLTVLAVLVSATIFSFDLA